MYQSASVPHIFKTSATVVLFMLASFTLIFAAGCNTVGSDAEPYTDFRSQLRITLELSEREIEPGQPFTATLSMRNVTGQAVGLVSSPPRISDILVRQGGELVWIYGTASGGPGVFGQHIIEVGKTLVTDFELKATERRYDPETQTYSDVPLAPGDYVLHAILNVVYVNDELMRLPEMEVAFRVKAAN